MTTIAWAPRIDPRCFLFVDHLATFTSQCMMHTEASTDDMCYYFTANPFDFLRPQNV